MSATSRTLLLALLFTLMSASSRAQISQWDTTSLPRSYAYHLQLDPQGRIYCFADSVLYRSIDDGFTWTPLGIFHRYAQTIVVNSTGTLYLGNDALGVFRSTDNGQHWSNSLVTEGCNGLAVHPRGDLFAGLTYTGNGKVHHSTDGGDTWTGVQLPNASNSFSTECFAFGDNDEVYAGTIDGFYRSTDFGMSWTQFNNGLLGRNVRKIVVATDQSVFIHTSYSASVDGLYRSTDRGQSWQRVSGTVPFFSGLTGAHDGNLYGTSDAGVFRSSDNGVTWVNISVDLGTSPQLTSIVAAPGGHVLVGGRYVFRSRTTVTGANETPFLPARFSLAQNYPNPFNPTTNIRFQISDDEFVSLKVFDMLGREVVTLMNENLKPGDYTITFSAGALASGVYVYRLQVGSSVEERKMILLR